MMSPDLTPDSTPDFTPDEGPNSAKHCEPGGAASPEAVAPGVEGFLHGVSGPPVAPIGATYHRINPSPIRDQALTAGIHIDAPLVHQVWGGTFGRFWIRFANVTDTVIHQEEGCDEHNRSVSVVTWEKDEVLERLAGKSYSTGFSCELGSSLTSLNRIMELAGPLTDICVEQTGFDLKFFLRGEPIDEQVALRALAIAYRDALIPQELKIGRQKSAILSSAERIWDEGIVCDSKKDAILLMRKVGSARATNEEMFVCSVGSLDTYTVPMTADSLSMDLAVQRTFGGSSFSRPEKEPRSGLELVAHLGGALTSLGLDWMARSILPKKRYENWNAAQNRRHFEKRSRDVSRDIIAEMTSAEGDYVASPVKLGGGHRFAGMSVELHRIDGKYLLSFKICGPRSMVQSQAKIETPTTQLEGTPALRQITTRYEVSRVVDGWMSIDYRTVFNQIGAEATAHDRFHNFVCHRGSVSVPVNFEGRQFVVSFSPVDYDGSTRDRTHVRDGLLLFRAEPSSRESDINYQSEPTNKQGPGRSPAIDVQVRAPEKEMENSLQTPWPKALVLEEDRARLRRLANRLNLLINAAWK